MSAEVSHDSHDHDQSNARSVVTFRELAKRGLEAYASESSLSSHLEGADPELAISFLRRGSTNLTSLKPRLVSCSDEWIGSFLDQGGLDLLFECLKNLGENRSAKFANAIDQLTCIGCIKAVMNSTVGLEHIVESQSYVRTLAEGKPYVCSELCL
jgi:hypothetical protein